tara:strand:+ start:990 stop:1172 length:183 start_codon:yes stop_codon:yes gene_type:complete
MDIHSSILKDEVKEVADDLSVSDLLKYSDLLEITRIDINEVLEDIAKNNIIDRKEVKYND